MYAITEWHITDGLNTTVLIIPYGRLISWVNFFCELLALAYFANNILVHSNISAKFSKISPAK